MQDFRINESGTAPPERVCYRPLMKETAAAVERILNRLRRDYRPAPGTFDELLNADGAMRARWVPLIEQLFETQDHDRSDDSDAVRFDPIPYIVDSGEWRVIEQGLLQRARLLNALVADFYGDRKLLRQHGLPPALLFANPGYLPQCQGYQASGGVFLNRIAFDLGRSPDGQWRVLANRTDAPVGLGFALQARFETGQALPGAVDRFGTAPLSGHVDAFADRLGLTASTTDKMSGEISSATGPADRLGTPDSTVNGGICAILHDSRNPANRSDARFLGRHLGITAVESQDVRVRPDGACLATPEGLQPLQTIVRQIDSRSSDPLSLSTGAPHGVPGLLAGAIGGGLRVENAIGSGVVGSAAFSGFLPGLCQTLFDESLILPDLATWWCGQAREADHVADNLDALLLHRAFERETKSDGDVTAGLLPEPVALDAETFRKEAALRPYDYLAREPVLLSTMPCWRPDGRLRPAPFSLRLFVLATGQGYRLLPGGLARVATQEGILCKDIWVVGSRPSRALPPATSSRGTERGPSAPGVAVRRQMSCSLPARVGRQSNAVRTDTLAARFIARWRPFPMQESPSIGAGASQPTMGRR